MSGYVIVIEQDEAGGFSAWSPDLPGCIAASRSYDECVTLMEEAIEFHREGMREDGDPIPVPSAVGALIMPAA